MSTDVSAPRNVAALLLSGGSGTRLWPISQPDHPKQFLKLFGPHSLYQLTLTRLLAAGVTQVVVVANAAHEELLRVQAAELGVTPPLLVLEPARRDSGPAIAAGVAAARDAFGAGTIVCAMPCDHLIADTAAFAADLQSCIDLAALGWLGTFGIPPTFPSTEFGYLQHGERIEGHARALRVARFHEKPSREKATDYIKSRVYDWNSGMFVFRADVFAAEAGQHMPDLWETVSLSAAEGTRGGDVLHLAEAAFAAAPRISIDYALFERSSLVAMVPARFDWSDVGTWAAVHEALPHDGAGNARVGDAHIEDATNCLAVAEAGKVVLVGVSDLVVIAGADGVFVAPRGRSAEIKAIMDHAGPGPRR